MVECVDRLYLDYDDMRKKIHAEYNSLVQNNMKSIINKGRPFIPDLFFINSKLDEDRKDQAIDVSKKVNQKILSPGQLKRLLEIKESALIKWKGKSNYYIVPIKKDIMFSYKGNIEVKKTKKQIS